MYKFRKNRGGLLHDGAPLIVNQVRYHLLIIS